MKNTDFEFSTVVCNHFKILSQRLDFLLDPDGLMLIWIVVNTKCRAQDGINCKVIKYEAFPIYLHILLNMKCLNTLDLSTDLVKSAKQIGFFFNLKNIRISSNADEHC